MSGEQEIPLFKVFMAPREEIEKPVADVLSSGYITQGKKVEEFEEHLRHFLATVRTAMQLRAREKSIIPRLSPAHPPFTRTQPRVPALLALVSSHAPLASDIAASRSHACSRSTLGRRRSTSRCIC